MAEKKSHARQSGDRKAAELGKASIPGWLAPVLYGALALFLFREFVFSDRMLVGSDTLSTVFVRRTRRFLARFMALCQDDLLSFAGAASGTNVWFENIRCGTRVP